METWFIQTASRRLLPLIAALLATACASNRPPNSTPITGPEVRVAASAYNIDEIVLELPVGDVEVMPTSSIQVSAELEIRCAENNSRCLRLANSISLNQEVIERRMYVRPSKRSKFTFRNIQANYRIEVPGNIPIRIVMGYGELTVKKLESSLTVDMSAGEIEIEAPRSSIRKVWADANFGDAKIIGTDADTEGERRLLVGAEASWNEGTGDHDVVVNLGAGDITVRLTP